jgi:hypothetical protein
MAKAKINILSVNPVFSREEIDKFRRVMNVFSDCNLSVSIKFNDCSPVFVDGYILPGKLSAKPPLKITHVKTA